MKKCLEDKAVDIQQTINTVILIGSICGALYAIYTFVIKRPVQWQKDKKGEFDKSIHDSIDKSIKEAVAPINARLDDLSVDMQEIREINVEQTDKLEWMNNANLDLLRQEILYLYNHHYAEKKLTIDENEQMRKLYTDYVAGGGNSFIESLVNQMSTWEIIPNNGDVNHK